MIQDNNLMDDFNSLSPDEQAKVIDFIKRLKSKQNAAKKQPAKQWKDIAGLASAPLLSEDAQTWVSNQRQEADRQHNHSL